MKTDRRKEIRVGIISIIAISLLTTILVVGNQISFFEKKINIHIHFPDAGGLKVGEPVMLRGVKMGKVESMTIHRDYIDVIISVDDTSLLHKDAGATISMLELTGGRKIDLHPGIAQEDFDHKQIIQGDYPKDLGSILNYLVNMEDDMVLFFDQIETLVSNLNHITSDSSVIGDLESTLAKTENTISNVNNLINHNSNDISAIIDELRSVSTNVNDILSDNKSDISDLISSLKDLSKTFDTYSKDMESMPKDMLTIVEDLKAFTDKLDDNSNAFGLLFNDPEFAKQIEETLINIDSLVQDIEDNGIQTNIRFGRKK